MNIQTMFNNVIQAIKTMPKWAVATTLTTSVAVVATTTILIINISNAQDAYRLVKAETVSGDVILDRASLSENIALVEGFIIVPDDTITTHDVSQAVLLVDNDKHLVIEENTQISINASGTYDDGRVNINLLYGMSHIAIDNKLGDKSEFNVQTPNASFSVRGTTYTVSYYPERDISVLSVSSGVVEAVSRKGAEFINAGEAIIISGEEYIYEGPADEEFDEIVNEIVEEIRNGNDLSENVIDENDSQSGDDDANAALEDATDEVLQNESNEDSDQGNAGVHNNVGNIVVPDNSQGNTFVQDNSVGNTFVQDNSAGNTFVQDNGAGNTYVQDDSWENTFVQDDSAENTYTQDDSSGNTYTQDDSSGNTYTHDDSSGNTYSQDDSSGNTFTQDDSAGNSFNQDDSAGNTFSQDDSAGNTFGQGGH